MKKILGWITVVGMLFAFTGQAAAFSSSNLTLVVYNENDNEVAIDLGAYAGLDSSAENVELASAGSISLDMFGSNVSDWSDLSMGIFGGNITDYTEWIALSQDSIDGISTTNLNAFWGAVDSLSGAFGDGTSVINVSGEPNTYDYVMNSNSNSPGIYAGLNQLNQDAGEASLGTMDADGFVTMYLYNYDLTALDQGDDSTTDYFSTISILADGSVMANYNPVPIPGSILLLGSGLFGLFGIRRKKA